MVPATEEDGPSSADDREHGAERRIGLMVGGTYCITRHIGSGGSSHVFEATHQRLGKSFAIKLLRPEIGQGKKVAQRFRREAKAIAALRSEHVVSVVDCGELEDQTPYLVMELLEGEDLRSLLTREGQLPVRRAIHLVAEACRGLSTVHAAGLVHRDLKPENLFVVRRSTGEDWCKVLDFGVAKMDASLSTAQGAIVGTVRYMAPEQLADSATVDARTDVYALGAILYECLSGRSLHEGDSVQEVMYSVLHREPPSLLDVRPDLPRALTALVARASSKQPKRRPQSTAELAKLLERAIGIEPLASSAHTLAEDDAVRAASASKRGVRQLRRGLGAALLGCVGGVLLGWFIAGRDRPAAEPLARTSSPDAPKKAPLTMAGALSSAAPPSAPAPSVSPAPSGSPVDPRAAPAAPPEASRAAAETSRRRKAGPTAVARPAASAPAPSNSPARSVAVGPFDAANPYGE